MSVTGATGDIAFMDKMLADFRLPTSTYYLNNNPSTWYFYLYSRLGKDKRTPFILNFHQQASSNHPTSYLSFIYLSFLPINSYIYPFIHIFLFIHLSIESIHLYMYLIICRRFCSNDEGRLQQFWEECCQLNQLKPL